MTTVPGVDPRWAELDDLDIIAKVIGDLLRHQTSPRSPGRGGKQPVPTIEEARRFMARLVELDRWGTERFHLELQRLADGLPAVHVAQRCGWARTRGRMLLLGEAKPTSEDMEVAARAFGRSPMHFVEYRAQVMGRLVHDWFLQNPDRSELLVQQLGLSVTRR